MVKNEARIPRQLTCIFRHESDLIFGTEFAHGKMTGKLIDPKYPESGKAGWTILNSLYD